jgi:Zn-dependent protease with chaperone function
MSKPPAHPNHLAILRLWLRHAVLLGVLILALNLMAALAYKFVVPFSLGFPSGFFEGITLAVLTVALGAGLIEWQRLREGGGTRLAHWLGGTRLDADPDDALHRRLLNVVDELTQLGRLPLPTVFVLPREDGINAMACGWAARDLSLCVTQGALHRLTRSELRALLAHTFGRIQQGQGRRDMHLVAAVWSLSWVHGQGVALMSPNAQGRVNPLGWLLGLLMRMAGWLGWVAGRLLQSGASPQQVRQADWAAVAMTDNKEDLGQVLRKLWHDQQMMRGRLHHPCADMLAPLWFHDPTEMHSLATHPTLPERVHAVLGQGAVPLPTSMLPGDVQEPRRQALTAAGPEAASARHQTAPTTAAPTPEALRQARIHADREALVRMRHRVGPTELRLTILALMMNPGNHRENKLWHRLADTVHQPEAILADVQALLPTSRLPEFERLVDLVAQQPLMHKRMLVEAARDLMRADGRVSPRERLWWLCLRHRLSERGGQALMRPITGQGQSLSDLNLLEKAYVSTLTGYVARFVPQEAQASSISPIGQRWWQSVMSRCGELDTLQMDKAPDADALMHALSGVQELSWMLRPLLLRAWAEEALNHSPQGLLSDDTADALRLLATLLDTPLPPMLASHYPQAA